MSQGAAIVNDSDEQAMAKQLESRIETNRVIKAQMEQMWRTVHHHDGEFTSLTLR